MPQIRRIRYVSLGHDKARMEDLILEMHDADGRSTDTALWLDNGGGKSSMLSLFFSVLRPAKKDFLGARAEQKLRRLEDYIRPEDHSLVVAEWEMDEADLFGARQRLVTGVFIERAQGSIEDVELDRIWFSFREVREQPRLSLDRLPVYEDGVERGKRRWKKSGFKQQMAELRAAAPHARVFVTEKQSDWMGHLDEQGLDTELFLYQIRMNQREGGAADLFQFRDVEDFIDFFVRSVLGEESGDKLAETLLSYRDDLKKRQRYYIPERRLVAGLVDHMRQLTDLGEQRAQMLAQIRRMAGAADALRGHIQSQVSRAKEDATVARAGMEAETALANQFRTMAGQRHSRATVADHILASIEFTQAEAREREVSEGYDRVTRELSIVELAIPAARAMRHRAQAASYAEQLELARSKHAPLLERLQAAATAYACAIHARIKRTDERVLALSEQAETARVLADDRREEARAQEAIANRNEERAKALANEQRLAEGELKRLTDGGDLTADEAAQDAQARWEKTLHEAAKARDAAARRLPEIKEELQLRTSRLQDRREEIRTTARNVEDRRAALQAATAERQALETDGLVLEAMRTDHVDLDQIEDPQVRLVAQAADREQTVLFRMWSEEAQTKHILRRLDESGLLPPSKDAETLVAFLAPKLQMVLPGWEYASHSLSVSSGEARAFVESKPHLATGVIVRDDEFERACEFLQKADFDLDAPIVVAPQRAVHAEGRVEGFVLAPSSDAHFDTTAGERERVSRQADLERLRGALARQTEHLKELEERAHRLASFRARFPRGHFTREAEEIERITERVRHDTQRADQMAADLEDLQGEAKTLRTEEETQGGFVVRAERALERIGGFIRLYGADPDARRRECFELEQAAGKARAAAAAALAGAREADQAVHARLREASELMEGRGALVNSRQGITDVDEGAVEPIDGDLDGLKERYVMLRAQYTKEVNESGLEKLRVKEVEEMNKAEGQYDERARKLLRSDPSVRIAVIFLGTSPEDLRAEVEAFIAANPDTDRVEELNKSLVSEQATFRGLMRSTQVDREKATERRDHAAAEREKLDHQPIVEPGQDDVPKDAGALAVWIEQEKAGVEAERSKSVFHEQNAQEAEHRAELADSEASRYAALMETLAAVVDGYGRLLKRVSDASVPAGWTAPDGDAATSSRIAEMKRELAGMQGDDQALDELRDEVHKDVIRWIEREEFGEVVPGNPMLRDLRSHTAAALEAASAVLAERLDVRLQTLDRALAAVDEFRNNLIGYALNAGEKGIQSLEAAQQISRMPAHMPRFGGKNFLKVRHRTPDAEDARRERMASLVDEIIASDSNPSGVEMVQRAVRTLGRPFRIEVMFPDKMRGAWYTEVERLGRDSGGEVLTSAILLYCNLARLRARNRGRLSSPTSVLLLDNPFGTASRLSFLEVQLEVARAAGVQLIYTTGVKDYDAVSLFPNINRLRPAGYDARHHQWILERTDIIRHTAGVDMARMVRESRRGDASAPVAESV